MASSDPSPPSLPPSTMIGQPVFEIESSCPVSTARDDSPLEESSGGFDATRKSQSTSVLLPTPLDAGNVPRKSGGGEAPKKEKSSRRKSIDSTWAATSTTTTNLLTSSTSQQSSSSSSRWRFSRSSSSLLLRERQHDRDELSANSATNASLTPDFPAKGEQDKKQKRSTSISSSSSSASSLLQDSSRTSLGEHHQTRMQHSPNDSARDPQVSTMMDRSRSFSSSSSSTGSAGGGGGKFVQRLRRTRSKLGLMTGGVGGKSSKESLQAPALQQQERQQSYTNGEEASGGEDGSVIESPVLTFVEPPSPSPLAVDPIFERRMSHPPETSSTTVSASLPLLGQDRAPPMIISTSPTMDSFSSATSPSSPTSNVNGISPKSTSAQTASPSATQRIGGWFSSMLNNSTSPSSRTSSIGSNASSPNNSPEKPQRFLLQRNSPGPRQRTHSSPNSPSSPFASSRNLFTASPGSSTSIAPSTLTSSVSTRLRPLDRMLDKAVQYFLDTDSNCDKCTEEIWLFGGVRHEGWTSSTGTGNQAGAGNDRQFDVEEEVGGEVEAGEKGVKVARRWSPIKKKQNNKANKKEAQRLSREPERARSRETSTSTNGHSRDDDSPSPSLRSFSTTVSGESSSMSVTNPSLEYKTATALGPTINGWPASFFLDFYSRPALTYRSNFVPIPCSASRAGLSTTSTVHGMLNTLSLSVGRGGAGVVAGSNSRSSSRSGGNEESGLSSDTGWGCMLRTGQSLLANALVTAHLGRDWRRPLPPTMLPQAQPVGKLVNGGPSSANLLTSYSTYTRILSLFLDTPAPSSPFSVHKFALEGQRLGKSVGEWFGPSTAAGAITKLVNEFEPAGVRVVNCVDGTLYENEVVAASKREKEWDTKVLVLLNLRLGIDGVNPIYHEAIKGIFRVPQSVGIAGGRPSSSYYFVGSQAQSLFYIDPHHPRPAVTTIDLPSELITAHTKLPLSTTGRAPRDVSTRLEEEKQMLDAFFSTAYDDSAWRSYHCDKVRKCALSSLDPSMLVGFLIQDERDWEDFKLTSRELGQTSSAIFSIAPSPPKWMRRFSSTALSAPQMSTSPGDDSFSEIDEESVFRSSSVSRRGIGGGHAETFEDDDVEFSEPEGWELDSTDGSDHDHDNGDDQSLMQGLAQRQTVAPVNAALGSSPVDTSKQEEEPSDDERDPVFVDSRTSMHSRESTTGAQGP